MISLPSVTVYPTTQLINRELTVDDFIKRNASALYDEWVCDRRWSPEDVCKLIMWEKEQREHPNS